MATLQNLVKNNVTLSNFSKNSANLTNGLKNNATLVNFSRNASSISNKNNVNILSFLVTPNLNKILVGSTETDTLILWGDLSFTNLIKH